MRFKRASSLDPTDRPVKENRTVLDPSDRLSATRSKGTDLLLVRGAECGGAGMNFCEVLPQHSRGRPATLTAVAGNTRRRRPRIDAMISCEMRLMTRAKPFHNARPDHGFFSSRV